MKRGRPARLVDETFFFVSNSLSSFLFLFLYVSKFEIDIFFCFGVSLIRKRQPKKNWLVYVDFFFAVTYSKFAIFVSVKFS
jgi:hypothetical protein